jgi:hypothetical protein
MSTIMKNKLVLIASILSLTFSSAGSLKAQWVQTNGPLGGWVRCFAENDTNLFAGTQGGVFRSTNNGADWTAVNAGLTGGVDALETGNPSHGVPGQANLYAATHDGLLL